MQSNDSTNPYAAQHVDSAGPGDKRPTAMQVITDEKLENKLVGKVMLVTGASSGLGIETVRALHATGADIYMQVREASKGEGIRSQILSSSPGCGKLEIISMNLSSFESIRAGAENFLKKIQKIDVLVNNAGVGGCPESRTADGFEMQFGVNHLGHFLLFGLLFSAFQDPSRVVNVTSGAHGLAKIDLENINMEGCYNARLAYAQSKAANVLMANEIERRFSQRGIHGFSVHPGVIHTGLTRHLPAEVAEKAFAEVGTGMKSPEQGAATQVWAAIGNVWDGKGGKYLANVAEQALTTDNKFVDGGYSKYVFDEDIARKLWEKSCEWVGFDPEKGK